MKLLLSSDLHYRADWFAWLLKAAPKYDAVAVAGDLLDIDSELAPQIEFLRDWVRKMKRTGTPLFLCCGNHDLNGTALAWPYDPTEKLSPEQEAFRQLAKSTEYWMDALMEEGACIVGGMVKTLPNLDGLIVTSLRYGADQTETNASLMEKGKQLRQASPRSPWLCLHHQPPVGLLGREGMGSPLLGEWVEENQPRIVLCGHDHRSPFVNDTCSERIGLSYVFNPGHRHEAKRPCHIELETTTMRYQWSR